MKNELNDMTMKICVELDFKDGNIWKSQTNDRKYFGCIFLCKNGNCAAGVVQLEFARAPCPPHSSSCVGIRLVFWALLGVL